MTDDQGNTPDFPDSQEPLPDVAASETDDTPLTPDADDAVVQENEPGGFFHENVVEKERVHGRTERYRNDYGANHPRIIAMLREAEQDNLKLKGSSRTVLFVHLRHAEKLWMLLNDPEIAVSGDKFVEYAFQMTGYRKTKAHKLAKLYPFAAAVTRWVESETEAAQAKGIPFQSPSWTQCLAKFMPPEKKTDEPDFEDDPPVDELAGGLAGDVPDPTSENQTATIELLTDQLREQGEMVDAARADAAKMAADRDVKIARRVQNEAEADAHRQQVSVLEITVAGLTKENTELTEENSALRAQLEADSTKATKKPSDAMLAALLVVRDRPGDWQGNAVVPSRTKHALVERNYVVIDDGMPILTATGRAQLADEAAATAHRADGLFDDG